jgi:hypothetical protein
MSTFQMELNDYPHFDLAEDGRLCSMGQHCLGFPRVIYDALIPLDSILDIPEGSVRRGRGQVPRGGAPPHPPVSLEQLLATQNDLMRRLVKNDEHRGVEH